MCDGWIGKGTGKKAENQQIVDVQSGSRELRLRHRAWVESFGDAADFTSVIAPYELSLYVYFLILANYCQECE